MPRNFDNQQDYIHALQTDLNKGLADKEYITGYWHDAESFKVWGDAPGFEIRLRSYGRVWGKSENEHTAWSLARVHLEDEGVLSAFQKMDEMSDAGQ